MHTRWAWCSAKWVCVVCIVVSSAGLAHAQWASEPLNVGEVAAGVHVHIGDVALMMRENEGAIANVGFVVGTMGAGETIGDNTGARERCLVFIAGKGRVTVDGVQIRPGLALGSWVAFKRLPNGQAMAMGDLVLTDDEINPVISALQAGGVEQVVLRKDVLGVRRLATSLMPSFAEGLKPSDVADLLAWLRSNLGPGAPKPSP